MTPRSEDADAGERGAATAGGETEVDPTNEVPF